MKKYMKYNSDDVELILKMYRHKIVHLAMPKPIIEHNGKYLSWKLHDENSNNHLKKDNIPRDISIFGYRKDYYDEKFIINIQKFKDDIIESITRPTDGYLAELKNDGQLQKKFEIAINQIYDPNKD